MANTPLDVQLLIIEWIYRLSQSMYVDYATLRACALVCRAWTSTAQCLLFRRLVSPYPVFDDHTISLILRILRTLRARPHLSAHVRSVAISLMSTVPDHSAYNISVAVALLELCPHVQGIYVQDYLNYNSIPPELEARLRAIPLQPTFLQVIGEHSFVSVLRQIWPSLRVLDLTDASGSCLEGAADGTAPPISMPGALQALSLDTRNMAWLLAPNNDRAALRHLALRYTSWPDVSWDQQPYALDILHGIHTLSLQGSPPPHVLEHLAHLESLVFDCLPQGRTALPQSLRHVGYHPWNSPWEKTLSTGFAVAALRALANLQLVTVTRCMSAVQMTRFEELSRDRGVEFVIYQDRHYFPTLQDVDWI
ncbi:hypothetical protein FA95DRAFT_1559150 [Auriscalpium vulgare]|uniref:Uncharacterized protein n=1 Tax=Auriscalpium vulgare TaxID=40419 RepID=A0ACB8RU38_9AGAM|nr:hypothetical protein FA95DRAFT_1559150 [Auriscalpium vulgare]